MPIYRSTLNTNKKTNKEKKPKKEHKKRNTKQAVLVGALIFCVLSFVFLMFDNFVQDFYLGLFGVFSYPLFATALVFLSALAMKKKYKLNKRYLTFLCLSLFFTVFILHLILTHNLPLKSYGNYLIRTYKLKTSGAGLVMSMISYPIIKLLTTVGAYVFSAIGLVISVGFLIDCIIVMRNSEEQVESKFNFTEFKTLNEDTNDVSITFEHKQEDLKKKIAKQKLGLETSESSIISSSMHIDNISEKMPKSRPMSNKEYILTPPEIVIPEYTKPKPVERPRMVQSDDVIVNDASEFYENSKVIEGKSFEEISEKNNEKEETPSAPSFNIFDAINEETNNCEEYNTDILTKTEFENSEAEVNQFEIKENLTPEESLSKDEIGSESYSTKEYEPSPEVPESHIPLASDVDSVETRSPRFETQNNIMTKTIVEEENKKGRPKKHHPPYIRPTVDLLKYIDNVEVVTDEECQENIEKLEKVLDDFKIPAKVKAVQVGPAVTRYEIGMPTGVSVKKVQLHADDIAMVLASNGGIRIEAPIPGKNAVGIEVPNKNIASVSMREMIESVDYQKRVNPMSFVLGKDINGAIQFCNLDKMPHLLVAGSTGSGKSVCLNTMLISMLYKSSPEDVRLILIDPKTVEFSVYANLPHLLTPHIITTKEQAINALNWAIKEMEYRYSLLQQNEVVNIKDYNNLPIVKDGEVDKLPYIVIVIDELNDLMIDTKREMEERIMKLAQKSRAAGIHLVIATQRPSVDVITGTIKANLPSRIAFALTNFADSKTVLDMGGAEKLLGRGDMLFKPNDMPEPRRVQGAYISSQEVSAVVKYIKANNPSDYDEDTTNAITAEPQKESNGASNSQHEAFDPILKDALRWFISANQASITMIQRRFGVGYARAARIIDQMEQNGFISTQDGSKPRQVLISLDEYNAIFN